MTANSVLALTIFSQALNFSAVRHATTRHRKSVARVTVDHSIGPHLISTEIGNCRGSRKNGHFFDCPSVRYLTQIYGILVGDGDI
ncbi:hypothetical protein ACFPH6_14380 [Streptomyces xiangluensis]|uniref:Secreted protein n=1 Tax=Streptomyces xiangluensis TaxID=2665720 RepID=A0ABV8YN79_9ACTN